MKNANRTIYYAVILILLLLIVIVNINTNSFKTNEITYNNNDLAIELNSAETNILNYINTGNKDDILSAFENFKNSQVIYRNLVNNIRYGFREISYYDSFINLFINELYANLNNNDMEYWNNVVEDINTFNEFMVGSDEDLKDNKNIKVQEVSNLLKAEKINDFIVIDPSSIVEYYRYN